MAARNLDPRTIQRTVTRLGKETVLSGKMRFRESVTISGRFEGEIDASGFLFVEAGADVRANVKAGTIIIGGVIHGNVEATERLEMLAGGKIYGNVRTAKLRIADGVVFEGKCEMIRNSNHLDIFSTTASQLKKTIQSV